MEIKSLNENDTFEAEGKTNNYWLQKESSFEILYSNKKKWFFFCLWTWSINVKSVFVTVEVEMYGSYGYISAVDMPLLVVSLLQLSVRYLFGMQSTKVT